MSKRCILKLFEKNGRGKSGLAYALPGQLHSQSACLLPWTIQQPPVQQPWSEGLVKLIGGPLPDPLGHPAALEGGRAEARETGCW
jgi:hypothetical protein